MGRSTSISTSTTSYLNAPLTVEDNDGGVALAGSAGAQVGGAGNVSGSTNSGNNSYGSYTTLDGGAIARAFDSTDKSIAAITNLTASIVNNNAAANVAGLNFVEKANTAALAAANPVATATKDYNTALMYAGAAIAAYFIFKGLR